VVDRATVQLLGVEVVELGDVLAEQANGSANALRPAMISARPWLTRFRVAKSW
jgi:hypothetical protein